MAIANLAVRFILEVAAYVGAGYAVYQLADGVSGPLRWILAAAASLAVIGLWWLVVAPRTRNGLSQPQKDVIGSVLMLAIAGAVALAGQPVLAIAYAVAVVLNAVLLFFFGQDARERFEAQWEARGDQRE
jgi:Protein of unknown function (DUF2568)